MDDTGWNFTAQLACDHNRPSHWSDVRHRGVIIKHKPSHSKHDINKLLNMESLSGGGF